MAALAATFQPSQRRFVAARCRLAVRTTPVHRVAQRSELERRLSTRKGAGS